MLIEKAIRWVRGGTAAGKAALDAENIVLGSLLGIYPLSLSNDWVTAVARCAHMEIFHSSLFWGHMSGICAEYVTAEHVGMWMDSSASLLDIYDTEKGSGWDVL